MTPPFLDSLSAPGDTAAPRKGLLWTCCLVLLIGAEGASAASDPWDSMRQRMVESQLQERGIENPPLLSAMATVPRHEFVPEPMQPRAYDDEPLELGRGQTMNQAYLSGLMISLLDLQGDEKVLEIGTGSGYDAAVLSRLAGEVYSIEIDPILAERAREVLDALDYENVTVRVGDGWHGWADQAPFDAILVTAAPRHVPEPLFEQLAVGGRMVVALGGFVQDLQVIKKTAEGREVQKITPVRLGPMSGEAARDR